MAVHVLALLGYKQGICVSSEMLASSVNTHPVIIRRLLLALQAARFVETRKGPGLGSRLSRPADRINLGQVYRAVEGAEPFSVPRRTPKGTCPVGREIRSVLEQVFASAEAAIERDLARTTLASILGRLERAPRPRRSTKSGAR